MKKNTFYEGLEIGAVSVKWVRIANDKIIEHIHIRHEGNPVKTIQEIFKNHNKKSNYKIVITGHSTKAHLSFPYRSESECIEKCLKHYELNPDMILSLGGETFSLYTIKNRQIKNILSSSKCSAGTGEFVVQQLHRMDMSLEQGIMASKTGNIVPLATRCSVHCKSDATHKLNKGECTPGDIAKSLMNDLAKKIYKMIESAKWPFKKIIISGGLALNNEFLNCLESQLNDSKIIILKESPFFETFGASLLACELSETSNIFPLSKIIKHKEFAFDKLLPLKDYEKLVDYRAISFKEHELDEEKKYILGLDAGSTTTKTVLYDIKDGVISTSCYLRTHGNPIMATKKCLNFMIDKAKNKPINIIQAAVTGSGREMVSVFLGNCLSFNEILTHARAASQIVPEIDTLFEIGGQDSKFISFLKGIPIDYAMNEGCSAGTGSFLEESISTDMCISVEKISMHAENSKFPISFGERCAAFINTDMRNALQQGAVSEDVIAGLVYSIVDNYISRVVGIRYIGDNLLFQGGVALNKSVALAMAARTGKKIVVPPYPELMGCVGSALMVLDRLEKKQITEKKYDLNKLANNSMENKGSFNCATCSNKCEIQKISIAKKIYPFGGLCSKYELNRQKGDFIKEGQNLIQLRNKIMFEDFYPGKPDNPKGRIGLPLALTSFDFFPFYAKLIHELGYEIVLPIFSKDKATKTESFSCYPCQIAHGAAYDLLEKDVDFLLFPHFIEAYKNDTFYSAYACPSISVIPDLIKSNLKISSDKILSPHIGFSKKIMDTSLKEIGKMGEKLGLKKSLAINAGKKAYDYMNLYYEKYYAMGREKLKEIESQPSVIITGRSYITCYPETNLALDRKISSRGYNVIPSDMIPFENFDVNFRNMWYPTQHMTNAISWAQKHSNVYICLVSCFSCGPDATIFHLIKDKMAGQTFCYLEIDSHTAHAGFETRVGAFLDIIEERQKNS